jgi:hypothetical protein
MHSLTPESPAIQLENMMQNGPYARHRALVALCALMLPAALSAQILETESARPLRAGQVEIAAGYELQHSKEGNETALPFVFELGLTNRLGLLVEPVPYTAIRPEVGPSATGPGDLEITVSYLLRKESGRMPAIALAAEEKVPTAHNSLIGTGKADHTGYIITSKRFGRFDTHANVGYTFVGSPRGQSLSNRIMGALATEFAISRGTTLYGEVLAATAAGGGEGAPGQPGAPVTPEASGDQIFGTLGVSHAFMKGSRFSLGVTRDNVGAMQIRPGITLWFR